MNATSAEQLNHDLLILVDDNDQEIGVADKADCHIGDGLLHRAFSVFLFDADGKVLLQQRSSEKPLWAGFWSNSCCSHPRQGEPTKEAALRRIGEELGVQTDLSFLYKFKYQAPFNANHSEHELCWVFAGHFTQELNIDSAEIADIKRLTPKELTLAIERSPQDFTPWLKMEWAHICADHLEEILAKKIA